MTLGRVDSCLTTPIGLIEVIANMRDHSGSKPTGFKLCAGSRAAVLALFKAMLEVRTAPDFIIVDGAERRHRRRTAGVRRPRRHTADQLVHHRRQCPDQHWSE